MKKISLAILTLLVALTACKKVPEVNLKYVDVERDLITVGTTTATVQCDYQYIATLKKAYLYYGEGANETDMNTAEMRVVQSTLYVDLTGLKENTTYSYYYEFHNGFNSMRSATKTFKTEGSGTTIALPTVVTAEVTEITTTSAQGGGEVTDDGGSEVTDRGICWSIDANPDLNDNHVAAGTGMGAFTAMMENLEANTTYHVRAYATNEAGTAYGLDREFMTLSGGSSGAQEYVDLCLPSGTLWAICNIGANSPEEYGDYFAWGETAPKDNYYWSNYNFCNGSIYSLIKYCNNSEYGYNGFTDNLITLQSEDDAATANWGEDWRTPTREEWDELINNTVSNWTTINDVNGWLFTASCGNSLFIPAVGYREGDSQYNIGSYGVYWSSSLSPYYHPYDAWVLYFESNYCSMGDGGNRGCGSPVRAVRCGNIPTPPSNVPEGAINGLFTINANGDQVYFSQGNLQYQASTNTWRFAEHQWDFVGNSNTGNVYENGIKCDNSLISSTYNGWIDLFGWATSGYDNTINDPMAVSYEPWSISTESAGYGPSQGLLEWDGSLVDDFANYDWGVYNPISNGGNMSNQWHTLTKDEMLFVFNNRITASGYRYARARVNGVDGVILLPDNWDVAYHPINNINSITGAFSNNDFSDSVWNQLESWGVVFFPIAGYRNGINVYMDRGSYWLVTQYYEVWGLAYDICINNNVFSGGAGGREMHYGESVRLVQIANP